MVPSGTYVMLSQGTPLLCSGGQWLFDVTSLNSFWITLPSTWGLFENGSHRAVAICGYGPLITRFIIQKIDSL